jgi:hypothetical protein
VPDASAILDEVPLPLKLVDGFSALYAISLDAPVRNETVAAEETRGRRWRVRVGVHSRVTLEYGVAGRTRIGFEGVWVLEGGAVDFAESVTVVDDRGSRRARRESVCGVSGSRNANWCSGRGGDVGRNAGIVDRSGG